MTNLDGTLNMVAGVLQLLVACYALRLNRLLGTKRAGWSLFMAFSLMTLLHALDDKEAFAIIVTKLSFGPEIVYMCVSLLLLLGMAHVETVYKAHLGIEAAAQAAQRELEMRVRERTAELAQVNEALRNEITEHQRDERALQESEHQYRLLFRCNPHPMWVLDHETLAFLMVNEAAVSLYGYALEEFLQMTVKDLLRPEDVQQLQAEVTETSVADWIQSRSAGRHLKKDGTQIKAEVAMQALTIGGRACWLMMATDVTEKQQLETQLQQAQKMEAIGQLAGGVAHDFNNILTVIEGYAQLLLARDGLNAQATEQMNQILVAAKRASNLTRQLLTFSRKQIMQAKVVDLNEVIGDATKMLRRLIGEDVALQTNYTPHAPHIHADAGMIGQVLMNLAINARDAMTGGGQLIITTGHEEVSQDRRRVHLDARHGEFVCLSVRDTGCGMSREVMAHLYEPFFTTKEVGKGTGLGLPTVFGIVKQHNGWIEVTSEPDRGTEFRIFLPKAKPVTPVAAERPTGQEAPGKNETILVVEDEPAVRELARIILQTHGYRVLEAGSGVEALSIWGQRSDGIDLVFTDMVMPQGMSGRNLAERLLAQKPDQRIVYTSGYSPSRAGAGFNSLEGLEFLPKPYEARQLLRTVRECLDGKS